MRYAYSHLGEQQEGSTAIVRWGGAPATVMLLDPVNFHKYAERLPCRCDTGGRYRCSLARLSIPQHGRWYAVVDLGGHASARPPTVQVMGPGGARAQAECPEPESAQAR